MVCSGARFIAAMNAISLQLARFRIAVTTNQLLKRGQNGWGAVPGE